MSEECKQIVGELEGTSQQRQCSGKLLLLDIHTITVDLVGAVHWCKCFVLKEIWDLG